MDLRPKHSLPTMSKLKSGHGQKIERRFVGRTTPRLRNYPEYRFGKNTLEKAYKSMEKVGL